MTNPSPTPSFPIPAHVPDTVHLLASLVETARHHSLPWIAAAIGTHPVAWHQLRRPLHCLAPDAWAVGVLGTGRTREGADVVAAFVVDVYGRRRALVYRDGSIFDSDVPEGDLIRECEQLLNLDTAA